MTAGRACVLLRSSIENVACLTAPKLKPPTSCPVCLPMHSGSWMLRALIGRLKIPFTGLWMSPLPRMLPVSAWIMLPKTWLSFAILLSIYSNVIPLKPASNANAIALRSTMPSALNCFLNFDAMALWFGPLYGGILIVLAFSILLSWRSIWRNRQAMMPFWILIGLIIITIAVNPELWYARLSPQTWLVSCLIMSVVF